MRSGKKRFWTRVRRREKKEIEDAWKRRERRCGKSMRRYLRSVGRLSRRGSRRMKGEIEKRLRLRIVEEGNRLVSGQSITMLGTFVQTPYF